ncbi:MAG: hypothetical protein V3U54_12800 [Thermodesulfobacteriota bacterium]
MTIVATDEDLKMVQEVLLFDQEMETVDEARPLTGLLHCSCGARTIVGFKKSNMSIASFEKAIKTVVLSCNTCGELNYTVHIADTSVPKTTNLKPRYLTTPETRGIDKFTIFGVEKITYVVSKMATEKNEGRRYRLQIYLTKLIDAAFAVEGIMDKDTYERLKKEYGEKKK